uniref:Sarcosine dehydrogenase n=1 Tax=Callorhinchus milii TaxID=7868 RepID=A0A4W3JUE9_CALMI
MAYLPATLRIWTFCKRAESFLSGRSGRRVTTGPATTTEKSVPYSKTLKRESTAEDAKGPGRPLPASVDAVVVGGGSLGCQTLYHLAKLGLTNVVLLERDLLTAGTTWHTAGLLWQLRPSDVEIELLAHTKRVVSEELEVETGLNTGWIQNGGLFIASNQQRLDEYKRLMSLGKVYGIESHVLSPAETKTLYPLMNVDDLYGTLYVPSDGTMDPAGTCSTLARAATARGATVIESCPVTGIQVKVDDLGVRRVCGVETPYGTIQTPCVVNCAGVWAQKLGAMAGVSVPLIAMHHAYIVTEHIEGIQNMPNVRDHDTSIYLRLQGDALSVGGYEANPIFWEEVSDSFAFSLFDLDWDVFTQHIEGAINRVPALETAGVKSTVCGPEAFTADHKPLMGEAPELRGFFLGCGFNSAGEGLGGADEGLGGPVRDRGRFHHSLTQNNRWIRERSHESYAKNYSVVFPHDEPLAGRNMRQDPLHQVRGSRGWVGGWLQWLVKRCVSQILDYDYYGNYGYSQHKDYQYKQLLNAEYTFKFPAHHHKVGAECLSCREAVAVFDMSYFGKFYLVGPDAKAAADWLFTADVSKSLGSTVYTCMLNSRGGTECDLTVSRLQPPAQPSALAPAFQGDGYYLAVGGAVAQHSWSHITSVLQDRGYNCRLIDFSEELGMISIQGPKSRELLQEVLDTDLSNEAFPFSTHQLVKAAGHMVRAMRLSFVGELGWELHIPREACVPVYRAVMEAGAKHGIVNAGYRAIDSLSIEKGKTVSERCEAGWGEWAVMGCAVWGGSGGLRCVGCSDRLCCVGVPMFGLEGIWRNGQAVGHLRRADFAFALDKTLGYGYISNPQCGVVTPDYVRSGEYSLERMGVRYPAQAHLKSPFDPSNKRVKGIY